MHCNVNIQLIRTSKFKTRGSSFYKTFIFIKDDNQELDLYKYHSKEPLYFDTPIHKYTDIDNSEPVYISRRDIVKYKGGFLREDKENYTKGTMITLNDITVYKIFSYNFTPDVYSRGKLLNYYVASKEDFLNKVAPHIGVDKNGKLQEILDYLDKYYIPKIDLFFIRIIVKGQDIRGEKINNKLNR